MLKKKEKKEIKEMHQSSFNSFVKQVWILIQVNLLIKIISVPLLRNTEN